jgi:hypothetical protein
MSQAINGQNTWLLRIRLRNDIGFIILLHWYELESDRPCFRNIQRPFYAHAVAQYDADSKYFFHHPSPLNTSETMNVVPQHELLGDAILQLSEYLGRNPSVGTFTFSTTWCREAAFDWCRSPVNQISRRRDA